MTEIILKDFANQVALMPIRGIQFYSKVEWGDPYDANIIIHNLEAESSFRLSPITRNTHLGTIKRLGYKFEATIYLPYNKLQDNNLNFIFEEVLKGRYSISLLLGNAKGFTENQYEAPIPINTTSGLTFRLSNHNTNHSIEIESVEYRPRVVLRLFGFVKRLLEIV
ncbi:MAG TPA: hypothetical protein PKV40_06525 [Candidatus Kapabacteria bacterium]|nr:hypothetical protein [Candidatus Kapabacteria bacterium]